MKTPSLEEVKQKYLNAENVKSMYDGIICKIILDTLTEDSKGDFICNTNKKQRLFLWTKDKGYAEIISYKEKTYQLSERQKNELIKEPNIKDFFIREGIIENDKLEVGKWHKHNAGGYLFITEIIENKVFAYGFYNGMEWYDKDDYIIGVLNNLTLATPQEVGTALINEAKKRGYIYGISIVDIYNGKSSKDSTIVSSNEFIYETIKAGENQGQIALRDTDGNVIFHNGVWAEIIDETIEIKKSVILNTPNDLELGQLIRKML